MGLTLHKKEDEMRCVLNDERVKNSHGYYLLNSGGDFGRFAKNPVMLLNHDQNEMIGTWQNLRVEGGELVADPVWGESQIAKEIQMSVAEGVMKGLSIGMYINAAEWRKSHAGVEELYVTEWEMLEASVVSIPSNPNALVQLRVYDKDNHIVSDINRYVKLKLKSMEKVELSAKAMTVLALSAGASIEAISVAVEKLAAERDEAVGRLESRRKSDAEAMIEDAVKSGKITAEAKAELVAFALSDIEACRKMLGGISEKSTLADKVAKKGAEDREKWDYSRWKREDPEGLAELRAATPEEYKKLVNGKNRV